VGIKTEPAQKGKHLRSYCAS